MENAKVFEMHVIVEDISVTCGQFFLIMIWRHLCDLQSQTKFIK